MEDPNLISVGINGLGVTLCIRPVQPNPSVTTGVLTMVLLISSETARYDLQIDQIPCYIIIPIFKTPVFPFM
jgi:hypothetical protein